MEPQTSRRLGECSPLSCPLPRLVSSTARNTAMNWPTLSKIKIGTWFSSILVCTRDPPSLWLQAGLEQRVLRSILTQRLVEWPPKQGGSWVGGWRVSSTDVYTNGKPLQHHGLCHCMSGLCPRVPACDVSLGESAPQGTVSESGSKTRRQGGSRKVPCWGLPAPGCTPGPPGQTTEGSPAA